MGPYLKVFNKNSLKIIYKGLVSKLIIGIKISTMTMIIRSLTEVKVAISLQIRILITRLSIIMEVRFMHPIKCKMYITKHYIMIIFIFGIKNFDL